MRIAWSTPALAAIAGFLLVETGLLFSETRRVSAEAGIARAMLRVGVRSHAVLLQRMRTEPAVLDEILSELTIGETYFLRDRDQLNFIVNTAMASRAADSEGKRPLRIWSAGCSSGEEPYSVAIMAREAALVPAPHIVGTDIATGRLVNARRGRYGSWSFRGVPEDIRNRYFAEDGRQFVLDPRIRKQVTFQVLNLAEDAYPSPVSGIFGMDFILCRNVLIYFDRQTIERVAARLIDSLADGGWLFVGASDPMLGDVCGCEVRMTPAGVAYRRTPRSASGTTTETYPRDAAAGQPSAEPRSRIAALAPNIVGRWDHAQRPIEPAAGRELKPGHQPASDSSARATEQSAMVAYARGEYADAARIAREEFLAGRGTAALAALEVRCIANVGDVDEGIACCVERLGSYRDMAELHYLHAVLLIEADRPDEAMAAARNATYLEPSLAVAHLALADASSRTGNGAIARREYQVAAGLLSAMHGDATVPAADGETALRLLHIAQFRLRGLGDEAQSALSETRA